MVPSYGLLADLGHSQTQVFSVITREFKAFRSDLGSGRGKASDLTSFYTPPVAVLMVPTWRARNLKKSRGRTVALVKTNAVRSTPGY